jgi:hypothetical protein
MRRVVLMLMVAGATVAAMSPGAQAATQVPIDISLAEPAVNPNCAVPANFCGSGVMTPYGHATEMIEFGVGCGGTCDRRTVSVSSGSLVLDERISAPESELYCPGPPGPCRPSQGNVFKPFRAPLSDTVAGGTGVFAGATGTLTGTLWGAGPELGGSVSWNLQGGTATIRLAGTITLAS